MRNSQVLPLREEPKIQVNRSSLSVRGFMADLRQPYGRLLGR
jgi:hypothetical protein